MDVFSSKQISQITILTKGTNSTKPHFLTLNVFVSYWFLFLSCWCCHITSDISLEIELKDQEYLKVNECTGKKYDCRDSLDLMHNWKNT